MISYIADVQLHNLHCCIAVAGRRRIVKFGRTEMAFRRGLITKLGIIAVAGLTSAAILASTVDARVGSGRSVGSRGTKTFSAPPPTTTAPKAAQPIDKSITQPGVAARPGAAAPAAGAASQISKSGGMLKGLLLGGFLGLGLAALFGTGALAGFMGMLLQVLWIAMLVGLVVMAFRWFTGRNSRPAMATATPAARQADPNVSDMMQRTSAGGYGNTLPPLAIGEADFGTFERRLYEIQEAYSRADERALGDRATPEMLSYFMQELAENKKKGVRNEVREPKLLQGDLSESWREGTYDYATVAMRFSILDSTIDVASGRVVSGSRTEPTEVTEVWTFSRPANGRADDWQLSAIQQA